MLKSGHGKSHGSDFHHCYRAEVTWRYLECHKEVLSQVSRSRASKDCSLFLVPNLAPPCHSTRTSVRLMTLKLQKAVRGRLYGNGYVVFLNKGGLYPRHVHIGWMICWGALWGLSFLMDLLVEHTMGFYHPDIKHILELLLVYVCIDACSPWND